MISQELFDELQAKHKRDNHRVEVYGVDAEGTKEFLHSHLGMVQAYRYCEAHAKLHAGRFEVYYLGNLQQIEDGDYCTYTYERNLV